MLTILEQILEKDVPISQSGPPLVSAVSHCRICPPPIVWGDHQGNNSGYGQGSTLDAVIWEDITSHIVNKIHPPRTFFDLHGTLTRLVHIPWFTGRVGRGVLPRKRACLPAARLWRTIESEAELPRKLQPKLSQKKLVYSLEGGHFCSLP